jgi:hypothetical protein
VKKLLVCSFLVANFAFAIPILLTNTQQQLLTIDSATPGIISNTVNITGLGAGVTLQGIDFRPANGQLYGLGTTTAGLGSLFTINTTTGAATLVNSIDTALLGTSFGFDFNPTTDRIRVTSDLDQNLRLNPATAAAIVDGTLNPSDVAIVGSAYTNSFAGSATTSLYGIDRLTGQLMISTNPNAGTMASVGSLGVSFSDLVGFDIAWPGNTAYASFTPATGGGSSLYTINLTTGAATLIGTIGNGNQVIRGLAVPIGTDTTVPEPTTFALGGLGLLAMALFRRRRAI